MHPGGNRVYSGDPGDEQPRSEAERVANWRLETLLESGYPVELAERLAGDHTVDLHSAVDLLQAGCPAETAAAILV